jgi:hypothetical protein
MDGLQPQDKPQPSPKGRSAGTVCAGSDRTELGGHDKEVRSIVWTGRDRPARDRNDGKRCVLLSNKSQCLEAVHARHEDVENQEIERLGVEPIETATAVAGGNDVVAGSFEK